MQLPQLSEDVRHVLENFCLSLTYILGDDAKAAHEAQMMHTLQLALGKNDIVGSNADRDIITCSLLLHNLVGLLALWYALDPSNNRFRCPIVRMILDLEMEIEQWCC